MRLEALWTPYLLAHKSYHRSHTRMRKWTLNSCLTEGLTYGTLPWLRSQLLHTGGGCNWEYARYKVELMWRWMIFWLRFSINTSILPRNSLIVPHTFYDSLIRPFAYLTRSWMLELWVWAWIHGQTDIDYPFVSPYTGILHRQTLVRSVLWFNSTHKPKSSLVFCKRPEITLYLPIAREKKVTHLPCRRSPSSFLQWYDPTPS